jgi:hypothetical protein
LQPHQRRGLATTGKATKDQVKKQVKKVGNQLQSKSVASEGSGRRGKKAGRPNSAPAAAPTPAGLKISFKPAELKKTTEKNVALQVRSSPSVPFASETLTCMSMDHGLIDLDTRCAGQDPYPHEQQQRQPWRQQWRQPWRKQLGRRHSLCRRCLLCAVHVLVTTGRRANS